MLVKTFLHSLKRPLFVVAGLCILSTALIYFFAERPLGEQWKKLDLRSENSLPTWYQGCLFLIVALTYYLIPQERKDLKPIQVRFCQLAALGFCFFSLDELISVHEFFGRRFERHTGFLEGSPIYDWGFSWVLFYFPLFLVTVSTKIVLFHNLAPNKRSKQLLWLTAGSLLLFFFCEATQGFMLAVYEKRTTVFPVFEEALELIALLSLYSFNLSLVSGHESKARQSPAPTPIPSTTWLKVLTFGLLTAYSVILLSKELMETQSDVRPYFTDIEGPVFLYAINTTITSNLLWLTAVFFALAYKFKRDPFFLTQVAIFAYLGLDDRFLVHEWLGKKLQLNDAIILGGIGCFEVFLLLTMGARWANNKSLKIAAAFFGVMLIIDATFPSELPGRLSVEDLSKTWSCLFFALFGYQIFNMVVSSPINGEHSPRDPSLQNETSTAPRLPTPSPAEPVKERLGCKRPEVE